MRIDKEVRLKYLLVKLEQSADVLETSGSKLREAITEARHELFERFRHFH